MRHILVEIICRNRAYHTHIKSHTLVNPQLEPLLKERIQQGTMFTYECPNCHTAISFIHSFLYHDSEHKLLIGMDLKEKAITALNEQHPDSHLYLVNNPAQLSETIKITGDELILDVVLQLKHELQKQDNSILEISYHDFDKENQMLWFTCKYKQYEQFKAIAYDTYKQMKQRFRKEGIDNE